MNPEEGNLRPQLKDRFGLSVNITTPTDTKLRQEIVKRRLQFDDNTEEFLERYEPQNQIIAKQIYNAKQNLCSIHFDDTLIAYCSDLAIRYQVEGLRADILLLKTSRAYAAYLGESEVTTEMVNKIAHFVFNHRGNQTPPESPNPETKEQQEQENDTSNNNENTPQENVNSLTPLNDFLRIKTNTESTTENFSYQQDAPQGSVHVTDTSKTVRQYVATDKFSIQTKRQKKQISQHHIFLIDSSGSMLKDRIIAYAKGAVHKIVTQAKNQLTQFSLISLFDGEAQHILTNTTTLEDVETALGNLKTGGKTNLIAGFKKVKNIATDIDSQHHLHIITDGKLNTESSLESTILGFQTYTKAVRSTRIIDAETGIVKVGIAQKLAKRIQANYELLMTKNEY